MTKTDCKEDPQRQRSHTSLKFRYHEIAEIAITSKWQCWEAAVTYFLQMFTAAFH